MTRQATVIKVAAGAGGGGALVAERLDPAGAPAAPDAPTLVFLHEGLGSIGLWRDFPERLCARLGLPGLLYDRHGHGRSDPPAGARDLGYLHHEAQHVLPAVLAEAGIARPILFGHSDGGTIALLFAAAFPDRPAALVAEAAHVFVEEITLAGIRDAVAAYGATDLPRRLRRHHGDQADALFRAWSGTWLSPPFRGWDITAELPEVTAPVLVLQGAGDQYGTPAQVEAIARGVRGPCETLLIPDCGHAPHQERPEAVIAATAAFLARHVGMTLAVG